MTVVDFEGRMGFLEAQEVATPGRCSNQIVITPDPETEEVVGTNAGDDKVTQYETSCTLASNAGGNDKKGGKTVSLTITLLGPEECILK
ncbi:MAG: hypothetical protein IID60_02910 [Proteobacteria bacterium]|nr:hypothetical protein [Pseudomonadota bacterium]